MQAHIGYLDYSGGSSVTLTLTTDHPASHYGLGVLVIGPNPDDGDDADAKAGAILDGATFRAIRDQFGDGTGASVLCFPRQRASVCAALGVPEDEPGIEDIDART